ncbi:hypothetical protein HYW21_06780 [Candidatus Woesearchaeota archaeon]|nr:hypothetical protein [Candidatus Woesearchaeota archaeon]
MPQKTLNGEDLPEEDNLWAEGSFIESVSPEEMKLKERTIHMKHNEEMNYNCKQCKIKTLRKVHFSGVPEMSTFLSISAHNKDWHAEMCDKCFDKMIGAD